MRTLRLDGNTGIGLRGAAAIAQYLSRGHCKLEQVGLSKTTIGASGGILLAKSLPSAPNLRELDIEHTGQDATSIEAVVRGMTDHGRVLVRIREDNLSQDVLAPWVVACQTWVIQ